MCRKFFLCIKRIESIVCFLHNVRLFFVDMQIIVKWRATVVNVHFDNCLCFLITVSHVIRFEKLPWIKAFYIQLTKTYVLLYFSSNIFVSVSLLNRIVWEYSENHLLKLMNVVFHLNVHNIDVYMYETHTLLVTLV